MNLYQLALKNIADSSFRSWVVALCALGVASLTLATLMVMRGAEKSLRLAIDRLGADIIVVPEGTTTRIESALLMGHPTQVWMPEGNLELIASMPGVQSASPQLYLETLTDAPCCTVEDMFLIVYDPQTDFTIQPWLEETIGEGLRLGEVVGGTYVFVPEGEQNIQLYGYFVTLKANLTPTGTGLDQSMFLTMETARDMARISTTMAKKPLEIPDDSISAVMVKLDEDQDAYPIALKIMHEVPGVTPIESPNLFQSYRQQMSGLLAGIMVTMVITLVMSVALVGLVFSMAANERRRELGVLRAMGATRGFVFRSLLSEAGMLAIAGGATGIFLTVVAVALFRNLIIATLGIPFILPAPLQLIAAALGGLALTLITVTLAAMLPAYRISHLEPAIAMRE
jgi:putative ABC transport system permease protein